jgi:hypothetical protein
MLSMFWRNPLPLTVKTDEAGFAKAFLMIYQTTRCHTRQEFHSHLDDNLKVHMDVAAANHLFRNRTSETFMRLVM